MWVVMFLARALNWTDMSMCVVFSPLMFLAVFPLLCKLPYVGSHLHSIAKHYNS